LNNISKCAHQELIVTTPGAETTEGTIIWIPVDLTEGVPSTSFRIFDNRPTRLATKFSEIILFLNRRLPVVASLEVTHNAASKLRRTTCKITPGYLSHYSE